MDLFILDFSIKETLMEKGPLFLLMDPSTTEVLLTTLLRHKRALSNLKLLSILEVSKTVNLKVKVLRLANSIFLKDGFIMDLEPKELYSGKKELTSILEPLINTTNFMGKVNVLVI